MLVAQIGARRHYAVPVALHRAGMLESLHTDWCANCGLPGFLSRFIPQSNFNGRLNRIRDRQVPAIPTDQIRTHFWHAVHMARLRRSAGMSNDAYWERANSEFGNSVVDAGFGKADGVYGFNAAAVEIFAAARHRGLKTVLDQTMAAWGPVQELLESERERWPGWSKLTSEGTHSQRLAERESQEWEAADLIICGSKHVVDSVQAAGGPKEKCRVIEYGYDNSNTPPDSRPASDTDNTGSLRVLFVGTVDLRKGAPYFLGAARAFDRSAVQFRMVGPVQVSESAVGQLKQHVELTGPLPRSKVAEHYHWADVFVLPTLAEGSANVCYEALSHGVPVITTPNAGSVVRDHTDGWIVPPRSIDALVNSIANAAGDRLKLRQLSENARIRAATFTWDRYMERLVSTTCDALPDRRGVNAP